MSAVPELVQQANIALREKRVNDAIQLLKSALQQAPDDFMANHMLGAVLSKTGGQGEAIARLIKATQIQPEHVAARTHLGLAYAAAGKPEMARQAFEAALKIDPSFATAKVGLDNLPPAPPKKQPAAAPVAAPAAALAAPPPAKKLPMPAAPAAAGTRTKDFTKPGAIPPKVAKKESFLSGYDATDLVLLGAGVALVCLGLWLKFGFHVEGLRRSPYSLPGYVCIVLGIAAFKAGMPNREHWRDDF